MRVISKKRIKEEESVEAYSLLIFLYLHADTPMALQATSSMAAYCFAVVESAIAGRECPSPPPTVSSAIQDVNCPIFVCFKHTDSGQLRGCIGSFASKPLLSQLVTYAKAAAFEDRRFSPVKQTELAQLKCTVSLLHSFERTSSWDDWVVGTHGIQIEFQNGAYHGTFLPSVAAEQGWTKEETLQHLIQKAGYRGSAVKLQEVKVERYQESSACCTYLEAQKLLK